MDMCRYEQYIHIIKNVVWLSKLLQKNSINGWQMPVSDTTCTVLNYIISKSAPIIEHIIIQKSRRVDSTQRYNVKHL